MQPRQGKWKSGRPDSAGPRSRLGIAAVELALCMPFLITLALGAIEVCNVVYVRTRMYSVAYEGARVATRPTTSSATAATSTAVTTLCNSLLTQLGVQGGQVTVQAYNASTGQAESLAAANPQDRVTVSISAPLNQNLITSYVIGTSITINAQATLIME
ncbi:MAG: TadE/TadG family type IV pilus assembly protein [Thermoguttaceae bacterium]